MVYWNDEWNGPVLLSCRMSINWIDRSYDSDYVHRFDLFDQISSRPTNLRLTAISRPIRMEKDYLSCCTLGCLRNWASVGWPFGQLGFRIYTYPHLRVAQEQEVASPVCCSVVQPPPCHPRAHGCPGVCGHWFTSLPGLDLNLFHKSPLAPIASGCLHASAQRNHCHRLDSVPQAANNAEFYCCSPDPFFHPADELLL
jgi:hypothetical protein